MIAVDTSALVAVVLGESDAERFLAAMSADDAGVATVSVVEAAIVVEARQGPDAARDLQLLIDGAIERVVPVEREHAAAAVAAWRRFGKGRHPAGLNFGDCFAYALADVEGVALLYKGDDFDQTDIAAVL